MEVGLVTLGYHGLFTHIKRGDRTYCDGKNHMTKFVRLGYAFEAECKKCRMYYEANTNQRYDEGKALQKATQLKIRNAITSALSKRDNRGSAFQVGFDDFRDSTINFLNTQIKRLKENDS